jgi:tetratricopeptide (TPR) repeat protein
MDSEGVNNEATINTNNLAPEPTQKPNPLKTFFDKLGKSPLFMGRRKFVTIPALLLALVSIVTLAVILIIHLTSEPVIRLDDADSAFFSEFTDFRSSQQYSDIFYDMQYLIDRDRVDEALDAIDEKIAAETNDAIKSVLILEKAYIAANDGRLDLARETVNQQINIFKTNDENLESSYGYLASLYERSGDITRAIEYYQLAVDNAPPTSLDTGYFRVKIIELGRTNNANED